MQCSQSHSDRGSVLDVIVDTVMPCFRSRRSGAGSSSSQSHRAESTSVYAPVPSADDDNDDDGHPTHPSPVHIADAHADAEDMSQSLLPEPSSGDSRDVRADDDDDDDHNADDHHIAEYGDDDVDDTDERFAVHILSNSVLRGEGDLGLGDDDDHDVTSSSQHAFSSYRRSSVALQRTPQSLPEMLSEAAPTVIIWLGVVALCISVKHWAILAASLGSLSTCLLMFILPSMMYFRVGVLSDYQAIPLCGGVIPNRLYMLTIQILGLLILGGTCGLLVYYFTTGYDDSFGYSDDNS